MRPIRSLSFILLAFLFAVVVPTAPAGAAAPTSPPARHGMGMAYDQARGEVVLFGGAGVGGLLGDTWTWDGTTWTQQFPATSPPARAFMGMAYDQARGEVVLFGGYSADYLGDTWTWDGTTWTQLFPATSPSARYDTDMAYDQARGEVVLFGGAGVGSSLGDTWTWDGITWTQQFPATSPPARYAPGMGYDQARGEVVLFGGLDFYYLGDTWAWDGTTWRVPLKGQLKLSPSSGPPGTSILVKGSGFAAFEQVKLFFFDSIAGKTQLGSFTTDLTGTFTAQATIPLNSSLGAQTIRCTGKVSGQRARAKFTVT